MTLKFLPQLDKYISPVDFSENDKTGKKYKTASRAKTFRTKCV